jgi:hypothetical protein
MILSTEHFEARRLARLGSRRHRDGLADTIDTLLRAADGPASRTRVVPHRAALAANGPQLRGLAGRLRSSTPLDPQAIGELEHALTDGTGPVYRGDAGALADLIEQIGGQLAPGGAGLTRAA